MKHRDLRLLVTKDCNYACTFCHQEGLDENLTSTLTPSNYQFLFKTCKENFNLNTVTFTGGEPLVRNDILEISKLLFKEGAKITLTTNGFLLSKYTTIGKYLDKINISLHTLDKDKYETLVGVKNSFNKLIESINNFRKENDLIKIIFNVTLVNGLNDSTEDMAELFEFAKSINAQIKFIELYPSTDKDCVSLVEIKDRLLQNNFKETKKSHRKQIFEKEKMIVTLTQIFCEVARNSNKKDLCHKYNSLFISPNGDIKLCRNSNNIISLEKEIQIKNKEGLQKKLTNALALLGNDCKIK